MIDICRRRRVLAEHGLQAGKGCHLSCRPRLRLALTQQTQQAQVDSVGLGYLGSVFLGLLL